ncbi:MAG: hypothetical protein H7Y09_12985, partial [Chitinophagaceae bacterium]|nr:hypothetical protein [Anaerolineae bacterium]
MPFRASNLKLIASTGLLIILATACQGQRPIEYQIEVTRIVIVTATPEGVAQITAAPGNLTTEIPPLAPPETSPAGAATTPEPTTDPIPTPIINQIIVAEQAFQNGRMFYLQTTDEIWVLLNDGDGTSGTWIIAPDTFEDGQAEFDPNITVPAGLYQPERGFGKLWRENDTIRNTLGFASDTEYGHVTDYTYT